MSDSLGLFTLQKWLDPSNPPATNQPISDNTGWQNIKTDIASTARSYQDSSPVPVIYRLKQTTANGVVIPYPVKPLSASSPGSAVWTQTYGGTRYDSGKRVTTDSAGNIYTGGLFQGLNIDFTSDKTGSGAQLLSSGNSGNNIDVFVAKYNSSRVLQWAKNLGVSGAMGAIAVEANGNIWVAGQFFPGPLIKLDSNGNTLWSGPTGVGNGGFTGVALDSTGKVFVSGTYSGSAPWIDGGFPQGNLNSMFAKFLNDGTVVFARNFETTPLTGGADQCLGIGVDKRINPNTQQPYNTVLLSGVFNGALNFGNGTTNLSSNLPNRPPGSPGRSGYIAKFDNDGLCQWRGLAGSEVTPQDSIIPQCSYVDSNGDILVGGGFNQLCEWGGVRQQGMSSGQDAYIAKFSGVDGHYLWSRFGILNAAAPSANSSAFQAITTDAQGNVYGAGEISDNIIFNGLTINSGNALNYDGFIVKYSSSGTIQWLKQLSGAGTEQFFGICVNPQGNPIAIGDITSNDSRYDLGPIIPRAGSTEIVLIKINP